MKVGDLVRSRTKTSRASSPSKAIGVIVKITPEYSSTEYHVLMGGTVRYFSATHVEVISK